MRKEVINFGPPPPNVVNRDPCFCFAMAVVAGGQSSKHLANIQLDICNFWLTLAKS